MIQIDASGLTIVAALAKMEPKGASAKANHHGEFALHALCQRKNLSPETVTTVVEAHPAAASVADRVSLRRNACLRVQRARYPTNLCECMTPVQHGMLPLTRLASAYPVEKLIKLAPRLIRAYPAAAAKRVPDVGFMLHMALVDDTTPRRLLAEWISLLLKSSRQVVAMKDEVRLARR